MRTFHVPQFSFIQDRRFWKRSFKRLAIAFLSVLLIHLFFLLFVAPRISWMPQIPTKTEVVQINNQELAQLKQKIKQSLMKEEMHAEYRTEEAPKDAKMSGAFNQKVPEETVTDSHGEDPSYGGGAAVVKEKAPPLKLSNLGLGAHVPKPLPSAQTLSPMQGRPGPYHPRGLDDKHLKKGNQNLLNAVESEYYSFITRFEEPVVRNWYFLMRSLEPEMAHELAQKNFHAGDELHVTIEFIIDRAGNFRSIDVIESSGVPAIDMATRDAIKKLGTIPNPPPGIFDGEPYFTRRMYFTIYLPDSSVVNTRPDLYW